MTTQAAKLIEQVIAEAYVDSDWDTVYHEILNLATQYDDQAASPSRQRSKHDIEIQWNLAPAHLRAIDNEIRMLARHYRYDIVQLNTEGVYLRDASPLRKAERMRLGESSIRDQVFRIDPNAWDLARYLDVDMPETTAGLARLSRISTSLAEKILFALVRQGLAFEDRSGGWLASEELYTAVVQNQEQI